MAPTGRHLDKSWARPGNELLYLLRGWGRVSERDTGWGVLRVVRGASLSIQKFFHRKNAVRQYFIELSLIFSLGVTFNLRRFLLFVVSENTIGVRGIRKSRSRRLNENHYRRILLI